MHRFWDDLIKPILEEYNIKNAHEPKIVHKFICFYDIYLYV